MKKVKIKRKTAETDISLSLNPRGTGNSEISTGCGFLNHMLTLLARHGRLDLNVVCTGDTSVDDHHTVEDIGICLGKALLESLGDRRGIRRYGDVTLPMDEVLMLCAIDISGRGGCYSNVEFPTEKIGTFDTQLVREFMEAFARNSEITLHFNMLSGINSHHIAEAQFKALGRALRTAVSIDPDTKDEIPSTKGIL